MEKKRMEKKRMEKKKNGEEEERRRKKCLVLGEGKKSARARKRCKSLALLRRPNKNSQHEWFFTASTNKGIRDVFEENGMSLFRRSLATFEWSCDPAT